MEILIKTSQLLFCLAILVVLHEFGHFLPAKLFKTKVEKFYLFFDAWKIKLFSFTKGGTEYGIGWLPLGGYVKIAGMIDESMDTKQMDLPPEDWEFRSKPAWQRFIVMIGGVTMNVILGIFIFSLMYFHWGEEKVLMKNLVYGIEAMGIGQQVGLRSGDKILKHNGETLVSFDDALKKPMINSNNVFTVQRGDSIFDLKLPENLADMMIENDTMGFINFAFNFKIGELLPKSNAQKAGLKKDDEIMGINGKPVFLFHEFRAELMTLTNQEVEIDVKRKGREMHIKTLVTEEGTIGFVPQHLLKFDKKEFGLFTSFAMGTDRAFGVLGDQLKGFKKLIRGETKAKNSLGSFIRIGSYFGATWDWKRFWNMTGVLSMVLALMNILPIPALDGGHIMFIIPEFITGRKPSDRFMEKAQVVGMVILLSLMAFALFNDLVWAFFS